MSKDPYHNDQPWWWVALFLAAIGPLWWVMLR
jgi:hypothetical protein